MNFDFKLTSKDELTSLAKRNGLNSWIELTKFIKQLPYGRNKNRTELSLVLTEKRGSCSSKHALLKRIADLNNIPNVTLILGIYKMNPSNTPKIGAVLTDNSVNYIPEAHCYLKVNGRRIDVTSKESDFEKIEKDIIQEKEIEPKQVAEFKVNYHKKFIRTWLKNFEFDFEKIWRIREKCIENLTE